MQKSNNQDNFLYFTFESTVFTSMIGEHSNLFDVKRLLGSMKREAFIENKKQIDSALKQIYKDLFNKLKSIAIQVKHDLIAEWCDEQIRDIRTLDMMDDIMDT